MRYSKIWNASIGHLNLTLGARNIIWAFLFHFSFVSSASWLILRGVMSARRQAAIALLRIVFLCDGWLRCAVLISCIRIICLHGFFFISWANSHAKDDCYCSSNPQNGTLVPSVRDWLMRRATEYRPCAQCQRLKRRDSGHETFNYTNKANKGKQCNIKATNHLINLERKQLK